MRALRIAICHGTVVRHDAIGVDIAGMFDLLRNLGHQPEILTEYMDQEASGRYIRLAPDTWALDDYDLVIYHHSIHWPWGSTLLAHCSRPVLVRYHNITPGSFFLPYAPAVAGACEQGRKQTREFIRSGRVHLWVCDSTYNRDDIVALGEEPSRTIVVPPFNGVERLLGRTSHARFAPDTAVTLLSVGRLVPNKGHEAALRVLGAYRVMFGRHARLVFVGKYDPAVMPYYERLLRVAREMRVERQVSFILDAPQGAVDELFLTSHVYLGTSQHEGFCVPIVEAQASGLALLAVDAAATRETAGSDQLVGPGLADEMGYELYARLLNEVIVRSELRKQLVTAGYRNVLRRFRKEIIENIFLEAVWPLLGNGR